MAQNSTSVASISNVNNLSLDNCNFTVNLDKDADDTSRKIANWFSSINFRTIQIDTFSKHTDGTGTWFTDSPEYQAWLSKDSLLWVKGSPGAGKTILSSIVIQHLQKHFQDTAIVFAYCRHSDRYSVADILASFVKQLAQAHPSVVLPSIGPVYEDHQRKETRLSEQELQHLFQELLKLFKKTYIVIDALDELPDDTRVNLPTVLSPLLASLLITSRPLELLEVADAVVHIDDKNQQDIELFIDKQFEEPGRLRDMLKEKQLVRKGICATLKQVSQGMFLLVALQMNSLKHCNTINQLRKTVNSLPSGLDDSYKRTLQRIDSQPKADISLARKAILWLTYAFRSLSIAELQHALAVSDQPVGFDEDDIAEENVIVSVCFGLIAIDKLSGIVRLVHETALDFFRRYFSGLNATPHTLITTSCLDYLSAIGFRKQGRYKLDKFLSDHCLGEYAYRHWGLHSKACYAEAGLPSAVHNFLTQYGKYPYDGMGDNYRFDLLSPAHVAIRYGLLDALPVMDAWFNQVTGVRQCSPLFLASAHGQEGIVQLLLSRKDVDINSQDIDGRTALFAASENGHEGVVKTLLSRDDTAVNATTSRGTFLDPCWQTPLLVASENGHEGIIKLLLSRSDVDINSQDAYGRTPLFVASERGRDAVVRLLLSRNDVDVNAITYIGIWGVHRGQTALLAASKNGHKGIVRILLSRKDVNVNWQDADGQTALFVASERGRHEVVKLLVSRNDVAVNKIINQGTWSGQTALLAASKSGHEGIVKVLLSRKDVDINLQDRDGRTALFAASKNGHEGIVKLLLSRKDVDINCQDADGQTALFVASERGRDEVVKLLISRNEVAINNIISQGTWDVHRGLTSLLAASKNGHEGIVKILLSRNDIDINLPDRDGRTACFVAYENGHEGIVKLLLSRKEVDINSQGTYGRTTLFVASETGHEEFIKRVLRHNDTHINWQDADGRTALFAASESGHEGIVKLLLSRKDVDINLQDVYGRTALFVASENGDQGTVKWLLSRIDVDINSKDAYGRTALSAASENRHEGIVKLLLARNDIDVNSQDADGRTALYAASENGDEGTVKLLLARHDIDINLKNAPGRTALFAASEDGKEEIVKFLLSRNDIDINSQDRGGRTAFFVASSNGHEGIVQLLSSKGCG